MGLTVCLNRFRNYVAFKESARCLCGNRLKEMDEKYEKN